MMRRLAPVIALVILLSGCGYHVAGRGDLMPKTMKTISVQPFGNRTMLYKLARFV